MTKTQKTTLLSLSFLSLCAIVTGILLINGSNSQIIVNNKSLDLTPLYNVSFFSLGVIMTYLFHYYIPNKMSDKNKKLYLRNLRLKHKVQPMLKANSMNNNFKNPVNTSNVANTDKIINKPSYLKNKNNVSNKRKNDRSTKKVDGNNYELIVAEGYLELQMYADAWIAASKSLKNKNLYFDSVKLLMKICEETKKWQLGHQVASEFIQKNGYKDFLASFYIANADFASKNYDYSQVSLNLQEAVKCIDKDKLENMIKEPILKKIYNDNIKSSLNDK